MITYLSFHWQLPTAAMDPREQWDRWWVLLSHFGASVPVADCHDPDLLLMIRRVLDDSALQYIPHDHVANTTYHGLCEALVGFSWHNRYFSCA